MKKLFYIDMWKRCLYCGWALALLYCLAACTDEQQPEDSGENMSETVDIVIGPTDEAYTRAITGDEIHSLRIYAFPSGTDKNVTAVGYVEDINPTGSGPYRYTMELSERGELDFIALINDGDAEAENNPSITLDDNTTLGELLDYRFSGLTDAATGLPMSTLEGTDGSNRTFYVSASSVSQTIHLDATRAMARLQLYFAKYNTGVDQVSITGATITQGPSSTRLAVQESAASLTDIGINSNSQDIMNVPVSVDKVLASADEELTDANTTLVATAYILENPYGATGTNTDGDLDGTTGTDDVTGNAYKLTVNYAVGSNNPMEKTFYLPAVERNQTIRVFGLLEGKDLRLFIRVAKWNVEDVVLVDYPTYTDCQPLDGKVYSTTARYVDTNNQTLKEENAFGVTFSMTAPEGQQFTPALVNNGNFELKVYNSAGTDVTNDPAAIVGSTNAYTLYVIPTAPYDAENSANNQTELIITTTTWAGPNDLLLINRNKSWNSDDSPREDRIRITISQ